MARTNAATTWDFTGWLDAELTGYEDGCELGVISQLQEASCTRWTFQLESCPTTGTLHWQGRFVLSKKLRMSGVKSALFDQWHYSITSNENRHNMFYVTKEATRVAGPWTDQDALPGMTGYIPRQIREIESLFPWQQQVVDDADVWDTRHINVVYDPSGCHGKSILKTWIEVYNIGCDIPFSNDFRDMARMVMCMEKRKLYIIDIPRALRKDQLYQFFAGIEYLKDGCAFDDRYKFRKAHFDCPNIWVFMNKLPDNAYLSRDRWVYWEFNEIDPRELVRYNPDSPISEAEWVRLAEALPAGLLAETPASPEV